MSAKISRPDPMRAGPSGPPERVHISVLTYESREDLKKLPKNVSVGLAVPKVLSEEEWQKQAGAYREEQIKLERALKSKWDIEE